MSLVYLGDECEYGDRAGGSSSSPVSSSSSSSIGKPDDDSDDDDADEVQSTLSLGSLEDSLPIKRGLSKHYSGKSKSFGNLGQVKCVGELIKSDNPFNKRRRTLMALNLHNHDLKKRNQKSSAFYSHSSHISMPLLPHLEDDDDDDCRPPPPPPPRISLQRIKEHHLPPLYPTAHPCT